MSNARQAVFLSYAREDTDAARRIADGLGGFGVEVWLDQAELRGGDAWDAKIRKQIRECSLFMPVISRGTQARGEGYFRREWLLAVERMRDMATSRAFVTPVVIDDTPAQEAEVPEEFLRVHWTTLPAGEPSPEFVAHIKRLLKAPRDGGFAARGGSGRATAVAPEKDDRRAPPRRVWLMVAVAALAVGGVTYFATWKTPGPGTSVVSAGGATAAASGVNSIAVLAFTDLSEGRNNEYFADGISEELLNVLAKVPGLRVAARTSAFHFKGRNVPVPEMARMLNVAYLVEGSVRRAGERVRITAQLIKAADGYHLWSDNFDREVKDVLVVQDEIAGLIAQKLRLQLGPGGGAAAPIDPEVYRLYLEARQAWNQRTLPGYDRAEELYQRAIALDPRFARAHVGLVDVWLLREENRTDFVHRDSPERVQLRAQAQRALALDPELAEAHASLGGVEKHAWRSEAADGHFARAIALNPNYATAHQWRGRNLMFLGRVDRALEEIERAVAADPLSARILGNAAMVFMCAGRTAEAMDFAGRALALNPREFQGHIWKSEALLALGRNAEALQMARDSVAADPRTSPLFFHVFARTGDAVERARALAEAIADRTEIYIVTRALLETGRTEEAVAALDADEVSIFDIEWMLYLPAYDSIRDHPRFRQMLATIGMTEAHARAQAWRVQHPPTGAGKP